MPLPDNYDMVIIGEWFPNPKGADAANEWIEIQNTGELPVDLANWRLTADGKKFFTLDGLIAPGGRVVLPRSKTKIALKNTDGALALYDAAGRLADQASFIGGAPDGKSANRLKVGGETFFGEPTPGAANMIDVAGRIAYKNEYQIGVPLGASPFAPPRFAGHLLGTALALAAAVVFILKSHEDLSHIFFQRDQNLSRSRGGKNS